MNKWRLTSEEKPPEKTPVLLLELDHTAEFANMCSAVWDYDSSMWHVPLNKIDIADGNMYFEDFIGAPVGCVTPAIGFAWMLLPDKAYPVITFVEEKQNGD